MKHSRKEVRERLRKTLEAGRPVIAAGAGIGLSAKFAERGGADLVIIYNSGRYRMTGYSSLCGYLPIGDANAIVKEMGEREVLPVTRDTPVIAGVFAADPTREMAHFLRELIDLGFSGVINFPSIAWVEGELRAGLESSGLGFQREVDMIRIAGEAGLFTLAYGFIEATHFSAGRKNSFGFELHGEKGTLYFDWLRMNELQYYDRGDPVDREGFRTIVMGPMHPYGEAFWPVQGYGLGYTETKILQLNDFIQAIVANARPQTDFYDGWKTLQVVDAVVKSIDDHGWVRVDSIK